MEQAYLEEKENILRTVRKDVDALYQKKRESIPEIASQVFREIIKIDKQATFFPKKHTVKR